MKLTGSGLISIRINRFLLPACQQARKSPANLSGDFDKSVNGVCVFPLVACSRPIRPISSAIWQVLHWQNLRTIPNSKTPQPKTTFRQASNKKWLRAHAPEKLTQLQSKSRRFQRPRQRYEILINAFKNRHFDPKLLVKLHSLRKLQQVRH